MQRNDLLTLLDREAETLADENNHSAAGLMRAAAAEIRRCIAPVFIQCPSVLTADDIARIRAALKDADHRMG
ncbi:hypothetical protein FPV16_09850 [Methylobacterium sp. W2]|uniref:hypothetical protein n=1 Tax=Methylobacterium sp. W2 TaxID=2598107 RepID=UPI001D0CD3A7|nr:hypothetical protein [Methylobacterium sp. W2]MCC0806518.1 hypothetical protein [Methylobacterium sp. W2]